LALEDHVRGHSTPVGIFEIDMLLANVCKLNVIQFPYELARLAADIAGGLLDAMPPVHDLEDPVAGPYIGKYVTTPVG
jgi:4-hydroxybutyryl-CoA dehydratase/vinylacetyl-CoA-Delta-isomerase